jgi:hypothetical protein
MIDAVKTEIEKKVDDMDEITLLIRRNELNALGKNRELRPDGLLIDELTEICAIYQKMRRKKSGPPSAGTVSKRARKHDDLSDLPI